MKKGFIIRPESDRFLLRNIFPEDKDFVIDLWTDNEVMECMGGPRDIEKLEPVIRENINSLRTLIKPGNNASAEVTLKAGF